MNIDTATMGKNLGAFLLFYVSLAAIATPIGLLVAILVRRMMPLANALLAAVVAGYVISVVILFVILRALFRDEQLNMYAALAASVIVSAGIVFAVAYIIHRVITSRAPSLTGAEKFAVFGEDLRDKPKSARRHKRR